ncbi:hypothetical protein Pth03_13510 [Planotetraspora thailandica]|uniref:DUF4307 domain-containing protein n=1 Tax=Planotetraspora thailandica TaxID=487172 RepID=A0A8J3UZX0_9ACTN|nr:DUF4307 domain-containing protein [Planotetraspora thailandica]GII52962.1 hypothetical protein Pth03_13510 [Planotetraspora thailandica]
MSSNEADGAPAGPGPRPILGTPDEFTPRPNGRSRFVMYIVVGLVVALVAGGWGYVMVAFKGNPQVSGEVITFDVSEPTVAKITFSVHKPADRAATCRLQAVDTDHLEVGSREVDVPSGKADVAFKETLKTTSQATAVSVQYCNLV